MSKSEISLRSTLLLVILDIPTGIPYILFKLEEKERRGYILPTVYLRVTWAEITLLHSHLKVKSIGPITHYVKKN